MVRACRAAARAGSAAVVALVVLSGCTDDDTPDTSGTATPDGRGERSGGYEEPVWMTVERERQVEYHSMLVLCLQDRDPELDEQIGILPNVADRTAGVQFRVDGTATGPQEWSSPGGGSYDYVFRSDAIGACAGIAESRNGLPQLDPDVVYDRMLDTRRCLQAEGHDGLDDLPPRDELVPELRDKLTEYYANVVPQDEAHTGTGAGQWSDPGEPLVTPYRLLAQARPDIGGDEWYRLKDTCVEFGVSYAVAFLEED